MGQANPKVDAFITRAKKWQEEFKTLRSIVLDCGLSEELKWGVPCYTFQQSNIVLIHGFKNYCALLFHKGALLKDAKKLLIQQTENVQAARQLRFTSVQEITAIEALIKVYIREAVEVEKAGLKVDFGAKHDLVFPEEFINKLDDIPDLNRAFESLTPGRQRAYNLYFSAPKQAKTREARIQKCIPRILEGKGLNDH
ncbi:MAG: DUF1801 domain-containing protein [Trueperaceae bacterium]|nr:DUF1801 domain-containing protein [Trueperaceae bacterium]